MAFTIEVEFLRAVFEAGEGQRPAVPEWPPSPARVFCALVAAADGDATYDDALRWLEAQEPPAIECCEQIVRGLSREGHVPLNKTSAQSYGRFPARNAGAKQQWFHVAPIEPTVRYCWPTEPEREFERQLADLADAVPYLGRSTSPARLRVIAGGEPVDHDDVTARARLVAGGLGRGSIVTLPSPGYLDALHDAFAAGVSAHEVPRRRLRYGRDGVADDARHRSMFEPSFLVLPLADSKRVGAAYAMVVSQAVRKALEACTDGGPLVLRGARPGEARPEQQVLILLLPHVGRPHGSGLAAGIGIVLPADISDDDRRVIYDGLAQLEESGVAAEQRLLGGTTGGRGWEHRRRRASTRRCRRPEW